jgi:outer membrane protein OmpA-like peptidoglycan-associated protein
MRHPTLNRHPPSSEISMFHSRKGALVAASLLTLLVLNGCATFKGGAASRPVVANADAGASQFPDKASATLKEGTFANIENLRKMIPGLTKAQVYDLVGAPHFSEGVFNVRQWDYIFNFRTGKGNDYLVCQYQIKYGENMRTVTGAWDKRECADMVFPRPVVAPAPAPSPAPVVAPVAPPPPAPRRVTLAADALFDFGKSDIDSISSAGRRRLDELSRDIRAVDVERVHVIGHADRIGDAVINDTLSRERAATVVSYLVRAGVPGNVVTSEGRGSRDPVVQCTDSNRTALIACLAPNRRVELDIRGKAEARR